MTTLQALSVHGALIMITIPLWLIWAEVRIIRMNGEDR
jgi:hypothetical protein